MANGYGYTGYYKPPKVPTSSIAQAAAGRKISATDPFGLLTDTTDGARVARASATPRVPAHTVVPAATTEGVAAPRYSPIIDKLAPVPAPAPAAYDIHTDPALQEVDALTGMTEEQARAAALEQKQAQLLQFGDPELARKLLGDNTIADAAGANPNSTLSQLGSQRDRHLHDLTEQLNQANLLYGGYRVTQEDQAAKDFQDALAQAASGVSSNIGQIDSNLASALQGTQAQRIQALIDAYGRHKDDPGTGPGTDTGTGTGNDSGDATPPPGDGNSSGAGDLIGRPSLPFDANSPDAYRRALALAARGRPNVGF